MKALRDGIMTFFNALTEGAHNSFWTAVSGRLFFTDIPEGTSMSEGPFALFLFVSDVDVDTFSENMKEVRVQFSLFSGASSSSEILDMDTSLTALFKDKTFTVSGWSVVVMRRLSGSGALSVPADTEAGTGRYWQLDADYMVLLNKQ